MLRSLVGSEMCIRDRHVFVPVEKECLYWLLKPFLCNDETQVEYERFMLEYCHDSTLSTEPWPPCTVMTPDGHVGATSPSLRCRTLVGEATGDRISRILGKDVAAKLASESWQRRQHTSTQGGRDTQRANKA
eukprot:TRINITY_DN21224_c0_g1_i1.p2 TRINITY_DN21224_c0_g1~~TRINITY_DN21224_c0_g1_i1.p2  ORF type:complete len:132 (+),score=28.75 TRINITY_DN21224_c0_g1_i1:72-467(+)